MRVVVLEAFNPEEVLSRLPHALGLHHGWPPCPRCQVATWAGEVVEADAGGPFALGDRVFGCIAGYKPEVPWGCYADLAVVPAQHLAKIHDGMSYTDAAALCLTALTAHQALAAARLRPGQRVLAHAAAGGVGSAAVQLAKAQGLEVVATASGGNAAVVEELGADQVIDYKQQRFEQVLRGSPVDAVIDAVGGDYEPRSLSVLHRSGTFVNLFAQFELWPLLKGKLRGLLRLGPRYATLMVEPSGAGMRATAELAAEGKLRPHVAAVMPLEQAGEAHRQVYGGHVRGKVVLQVAAAEHAQ
ncbi:NADPH:quinone reductase isoform B [Micractinium conductrix]|uniref:NADPH:quinone reductase isoform A n=1 Tax=Micractinium conductrix TaxID=554055 RepID=A0A2P6VHZ0_9CHLO|nr:NADPH:quinone reductase isoform A [Micractinium conductrix]PSC73704.1 NADPH:quinone reductase isoform B [Micractinium conductrix]|eukprot:PSC73703.1 NADPH:quinone reductase isoform A [Micractinium conductrix]